MQKLANKVSFRIERDAMVNFRMILEEIFKNPYRIDVFSAGAEISVGLIRSMTSAFALKGDRVRVVRTPS